LHETAATFAGVVFSAKVLADNGWDKPNNIKAAAKYADKAVRNPLPEK
jgi:hypothetical protein